MSEQVSEQQNRPVTFQLLQSRFMEAYQQELKIPVRVTLALGDRNDFQASLPLEQAKSRGYVTHIAAHTRGNLVPIIWDEALQSGQFAIQYQDEKHAFFRSPNEITRTVSIEHAGEKIQIEVHVHLSQEEIRSLVVPEVLAEITRQMRMYAPGSAGLMPITNNKGA